MILILIKSEHAMDLAIHGVSKKNDIFFLANYTLTSQLIIINIFTAIIGLFFLIFFNYLIIYNDQNINLKITENNKNIIKISNYLKESAISRVQLFNEECESVLIDALVDSSICEKLELSEPQLDPSLTQKYLIQNFFNDNFTVIIYDNFKRVFADTGKMYTSSEVVEVDIQNTLKNIGFYSQYKNFYLDLYQDMAFFLIKKKYQYKISKFLGNISIIVETKATQSKISNLHFDKENNLIQKISIPIINNSINYGVILITSVLNQPDQDKGINSFNLINLYFVIIIIMFFSSLLFSRSIVSPIKLLQKNIEVERDKSLPISKVINYPNRKDEIGQLSYDIKSMSVDLKKRIREMEELASDVSHELKNPLAGLKSATDLLQASKLDEGASKLLLKNMSKDVDRMNILISDIANYILTGVEISEEVIEEVELISFLKDFKNTLYNNNFSIKIETQEKEIFLRINKNKFIQVIYNLLDNSSSYIPKNSLILIFIKIDDNNCTINLVDQGPGIPIEYKYKIFERFYTDRPKDKISHSGLGLSISKKIIEDLGGSIYLMKSPHLEFKGACFEIKLPLKGV